MSFNNALLQGDHECVSLSNVVLHLHVGIRDWERSPDRPQKVRIDADCLRPLQSPPAGIAECIDYSRLYRYLTTEWPARGHVDLIETLAHDFINFAYKDETITAVRVRITKLDVYLDTAEPSFQIIKYR